MSDLLTFCAGEAGVLRRDIEALVRLESPSTDKAAVDRCGAAVAALMAQAGASVSVVPQTARGDHIRADVGTGSRGVLVIGHFDTVWPVGQIERMPVRAEDGRLYGPGIYDMKASIAVAALALRALGRRAAVPRVTLLWTTDEEIGSGTSRSMIESLAAGSTAVLVVEPSLPGGGVKTRRKGVGEFTIEAQGISAHAGLDPGSGASAVHELAHQVRILEDLQAPDRGITINVGRFEGGTRGNVVAEIARAVVDVRVAAVEDAARLEAALRSLRPRDPRVRLEVTGGINRPPLERSEGVARLYEQAREVAAGMGMDLDEGSAGGASDGNFTAALGVPTLDGLGPRGGGAHALHEHVIAADLPWRAAFLAALIGRFAE